MAYIYVDPTAAGDATAVSYNGGCYALVGPNYSVSPTVTSVEAASSACLPCTIPPDCENCNGEPGTPNRCCFDDANALSTISWSFTADTSGWNADEIASWSRISSGAMTQRMYQCSTGLGDPAGPSPYFDWSLVVGEGTTMQWLGTITDNTPGGGSNNVSIDSSRYGGSQLPIGGGCCGTTWSGTAEVYSVFSDLGPATGWITITTSQNYCRCNDSGGCDSVEGDCDGTCPDDD